LSVKCLCGVWEVSVVKHVMIVPEEEKRKKRERERECNASYFGCINIS